MPYSVNQLTTVADCDAVLNIASKEKKDLEWKKISIERQKETYAENAVEIATELAAKEAELTALNAVIAGLPDGELKEENIKKEDVRSTVFFCSTIARPIMAP